MNNKIEYILQMLPSDDSLGDCLPADVDEVPPPDGPGRRGRGLPRDGGGGRVLVQEHEGRVLRDRGLALTACGGISASK